MTQEATANPISYEAPGDAAAKPARGPRIWPAIAIIVLMWMAMKLPTLIAPGSQAQFLGMFFAPMIGGAAILIWWLAASRVPWAERVIGLLAFIGGGLIVFFFSHPSVRLAITTYAVPIAVTVWTVWIAIARRSPSEFRRIGLVVVLLISWSIFTALRLDGLAGNLSADISWRWSETPEQRFLASRTRASKPTTNSSMSMALAPGDWPGFRGPFRDGRLTGATINIDWAQHPPKQLWKHLVGPGWGSFAAVGDRIYTQEQRGDKEAVVCYQADTGDELWAHDDHARFTEIISGPGPRATPTFSDGKLYAFGAQGRLNCLDPNSGKVIWSADAAADSDAKIPSWGFSSSPLVAHGLVTVLTGGKGKSVCAYDAVTGKPAWSTGDGWSYASTQLSKIGGVEQLLYVTNNGAAGLDPVSGRELWQHRWQISGNMNRVTQPNVVSDNDLIFGAFFGVGTRRIHITRNGAAWKDQEVWTSRQVRPYYNDGVVHQNHFYGFDGSNLTCVNLDDGKSLWRSNDYGNGQLLLLEDQQLLLVLSEAGEVALVDAKPDAHHEIGRFAAIKGKTWNHPVIAHGKLFVRNGGEAACYDVRP